jgi:hypothetical protein
MKPTMGMPVRNSASIHEPTESAGCSGD